MFMILGISHQVQKDNLLNVIKSSKKYQTARVEIFDILSFSINRIIFLLLNNQFAALR